MTYFQYTFFYYLCTMSKVKKVPTCDLFKLKLVQAVNCAIYEAAKFHCEGVETLNQPAITGYLELSFTEIKLIHLVYESKLKELKSKKF